jgi:stress-induced morphogen
MDIVSTEEVKRRIEAALPGSDVTVDTFRGADHFQAVVVAPQFRDRTLVEQHRMVYAALEGLIGGPVHALSLKTSAPPAGDGPV